MAKKNEEKFNYKAVVRKLKENGPQNLYLLWGPEDYLREYFLSEIKGLCLPDGDDSFSYKRMNGPDLDAVELQQAVDAFPFLSERSLVEVRGVDLNRLKDADAVIKVLADIPDYCTVVFVQGTDFEPDGRLKQIKKLRSIAEEIEFTQQQQNELTRWIAKRFAALGKSIEFDASQRLIFISGDLMNRLIPEIDKIAAYAKGERVTVSDVEAVAHHIPEAVIFTMTDQISQKSLNNALATLSELLSDKNNEPIAMLGMLGLQMRRLYGAKLAQTQNLGAAYVKEVCGCKYDFQVTKLMQAARGYTLPQLKKAVELCAETDYRLKSSGEDDREIFKELVVRIAAGESDGQD
ncbi:MAG: DNA polymerase III subunit delta [Oscillospiraceae bacterium]|nr:DNA polymerase III subunit delta [Oscillospiraceae bacterium]